MSDPAKVREAIRPNTRIVWIETPTNPMLKIFDIAAIAEVATKAQRPARRRQHVRDADAPAPARARRDRRRALDDEVPERPLRRRRRRRRSRATRRSPRSSTSSRTRSAACRARSTATWCCAASRRSACACGSTSQSARIARRAPRAAPAGRARLLPRPRRRHPGHALAARQMKGFGGMISFELRGTGWTGPRRPSSRRSASSPAPRASAASSRSPSTRRS